MKRKLSTENIDSKKSVIVVFPEKESKKKTMGWVQDIAITDKEIIFTVKPIVYKACFEGEPIKFGIRGKNIGKSYAEMLKKFETSQHEVLLLSENKGVGLSKKEFNEKLESMLHRMVTTKYWQELHKEFKKGYVA